MHIAPAKIEADYPMILCVDDDPRVVDALGRQLHWYKVRVTKALHGMQGIWLSQVVKPDLVITDFKMPMCDGHELLRVVNYVPVVVVTGYQDDDLRESLLAAGAADVLYKPVDSRCLMDVIKRYVELKKRR